MVSEAVSVKITRRFPDRTPGTAIKEMMLGEAACAPEKPFLCCFLITRAFIGKDS